LAAEDRDEVRVAAAHDHCEPVAGEPGNLPRGERLNHGRVGMRGGAGKVAAGEEHPPAHSLPAAHELKDSTALDEGRRVSWPGGLGDLAALFSRAGRPDRSAGRIWSRCRLETGQSERVDPTASIRVDECAVDACRPELSADAGRLGRSRRPALERLLLEPLFGPQRVDRGRDADARNGGDDAPGR
jgi:hypothetical protein